MIEFIVKDSNGNIIDRGKYKIISEKYGVSWYYLYNIKKSKKFKDYTIEKISDKPTSGYDYAVKDITDDDKIIFVGKRYQIRNKLQINDSLFMHAVCYGRKVYKKYRIEKIRKEY